MQTECVDSSKGSARARLAVIIPMYNEEDGAEKCIRAVTALLREALPASVLYVVNDGSKDNTFQILNRLTAEAIPFKLVNHEVNQGYGAALLTGARAALRDGFDFGLFMDSDLTNDPKWIPHFERAIQGPVDIVKGSRYIENGGMDGVPFYRQAISRVGNTIARFLFNMGIRDCTNGFRAVRLSMLENLKFEERGFPLIVEELYLLKKKGARAAEVPYILTSRGDDENKGKFRYSYSTFYRYLKYCFKAALI